jgi:iron complex outermembrane receptor protein
MATVAYDVNADTHVYAKWATGYRAGGASSRSPTYRGFDPETVTSYEVGLKADLFDRRARFNIAGYIMERKNSQVDFNAIFVSNGSNVNVLETVNVPGTTKIRGIEADLTVKPIDGLTLNASYAYTYTKLPLVTNPFTGIQQNVYIVFTPRNAASGSIDYEVPANIGDATLRFHLDGNYSQATQTFDQFATKNDSAVLFNGRISLADIPVSSGGQKLTVGVWGRNIFNEAHVYRRDPSNSIPAFGAGTNGNINNILGDYGNFNAPRTYGIDATINF